MPVFGLIIAMDVLTALLALFVLKPMRSTIAEGQFALKPAE
jgi:hypothetical protein